MKSKTQEVICTECFEKFISTPKKSFVLGFPTFLCPSCDRKIHYPLTPFWLGLYRLLFCLMLALFIIRISQGELGLPGLLGIAATWALIKDSIIRKKVRTAREKVFSLN